MKNQVCDPKDDEAWEKVFNKESWPDASEEGRVREVFRNGLKNRPERVNARNSYGLTTLMVACHRGWYEEVDELLKRGASSRSKDKSLRSVWVYAMNSGNTAVFKRVLQAGVSLKDRDEEDWTMLMKSMLFVPEMAQAVLELGVNVNEMNSMGLSALTIAVTFGKVEMMDMLFRNARDLQLDLRNEEGMTPVMFSVLLGNQEAFHWLKDKGVNVHQKHDDGSSLLHYAVTSRSFDMVQDVLQEGLELNGIDHEGATPLMLASYQYPKIDIVELLLKNGADWSLKNHEGLTALELATRNEQKEIQTYV